MQFNYRDIKGLSKLSKDQQFFIKKFLKLANELYKEGDKTLTDLLKTQDTNAEELLKDIANIMLKYKVKDDKMNLSLMQEKQITAQLDKKVNDMFANEYKEENAAITETLKKQANDKYHINNYLLSFGMDFTLEKISKRDLENILNHKIQGKNYSNRIWENKNAVAKKIKHEVRKFLRGETNLNSIEKEIRKKFDVNKMCSTRLARNEIARVQNAANEQFFKDNNGEYLLYSATLDGHTCSKCKEYDGKTFKVDEDRPELPLHVNDRCSYILIPNKEYRPTQRLDNINKNNIDYMTYKEWKEKEKLTH